MADYGKWLDNLGNDNAAVDGLVPVSGYIKAGRPPEEVVIMEKAAEYGAHAVFFEAGRNDRPAVAQAFIFISDGPEKDLEFAALHQRLWSWGGVPLLYRKTRGLVQLFRCAHKPDFVNPKGKIVCHPIKRLKLATEISSDPWWDATRLRNGTLWDDPTTTKLLLSSHKAAHRKLFATVKKLYQDLNAEKLLSDSLRRKLLILSLLIAYLEAREVLLPDYFAQFLPGATKFFQVLSNGQALLDLLANLEERFNGNVFTLSDDDRQFLPSNSQQLERFATLVEAKQEITGQLSFWELYSFKDLPVELISQIYQLFVEAPDEAVYTPPFLVRLMLDEILDEKRLDRLQQNDEVILDPSCGSGVFKAQRAE